MTEVTLLDELAGALPDLPRWVAPRGLLLEHRCEVLLGTEGKRGAGYLVLEPDAPQAYAVHRPVASLVAQLAGRVRPTGSIFAPIENAGAWRALLPGWREQAAVVHVHPAPEQLPRPAHPARFLTLSDLERLEHVPQPLAREIERALAHGPVAAAFEEDSGAARPLAFCHAPFRTESWFDLAIETVDEHRRRGLATSAAAYLIHHMLAQGRRPVWGALDADTASMSMAKKYGFRAVDRMMVFGAPRAAVAGAVAGGA